MKKIITALTLGALIGTAAFADVEVSLNYRQRATMFAAYEGEKKGLFATDIYNGNGTDNLNYNKQNPRKETCCFFVPRKPDSVCRYMV